MVFELSVGDRHATDFTFLPGPWGPNANRLLRYRDTHGCRFHSSALRDVLGIPVPDYRGPRRPIYSAPALATPSGKPPKTPDCHNPPLPLEFQDTPQP